MLILGVDPGLRATGFAVVDGGPLGLRLLEHGVIRAEDEAPLPVRLHHVYQEMQRLIVRMRPAQMAVEDLYAARRFPRMAILMGHVRGIVCLAAAEQRVEVAALPPAAVKQAICGFGGASKSQIQRSVQRLLRVAHPLDVHTADAAAMALTALSRAGVPLHGGPTAVPSDPAVSEAAR